MKIAVLLSGNGVFDGSEIQESVFTMLAIKQHGCDYQCIAPNINQLHVLNHISGEEMDEKRNVLIEAARIARGDIKDLSTVTSEDFAALVLPGGFGAAKNLTTWALKGPEGEIDSEVKRLVGEFIAAKKPIAALCMAPTTIAKALEGSAANISLTVGTTNQDSPYDIKGISEGINEVGAKAIMKNKDEVLVDAKNKIVSAPCYMMDVDIVEVHDNIQQAINKMIELI